MPDSVESRRVGAIACAGEFAQMSGTAMQRIAWGLSSLSSFVAGSERSGLCSCGRAQQQVIEQAPGDDCVSQQPHAAGREAVPSWDDDPGAQRAKSDPDMGCISTAVMSSNRENTMISLEPHPISVKQPSLSAIRRRPFHFFTGPVQYPTQRDARIECQDSRVRRAVRGRRVRPAIRCFP